MSNYQIQKSAIITLLALAASSILLGGRLGSALPVVLLLGAALAHAVVLLDLTGKLHQSSRMRSQLTDRLLSVGVSFLALSLLLRAWRTWVVGSAARLMVPSAAEFFTLSGLLAIVGALAWLRPTRTRGFGRIRTLLDYSILIVAVSSLAWLILLEPPIELGMADFSSVLWLGIAPMLDLVLVAILIRLWLTRTLSGAPVRNLGLLAWLTLRLAADLGYAFTFLQERLIHPSSPAIGWLLSAVALWNALRIESPQVNVDSLVPAHGPSLPVRMGHSLPVVAIYLVVGFAIIDRWISGEFSPFAIVTSVFLMLLLLARQGVISGQAEMRQYASLVNSAADLAFVSDKDGRFILVNPAFARATGASSEGAGRSSLLEVIEDRSLLGDVLEQASLHGWSGELAFLTPAGDKVPVQLSLMPIYDERRGQLVLAGTGHDLSETMQREQELRDALRVVGETRAELAELNIGLEKKVSERTLELEKLVSHLETLNEELKELDTLKSEFVTLVSHELRSPLTNIRSGLELAIRRERTALSESGTETLDLVLQETDRLTSFVETILDLSALEAGRFPIKLKAIDPVVVVPMIRNRFPNREASRIRSSIEDPTPYLVADEPSLASVLFHLLDNAIKYAPGSPIEIGVVADDGEGLISVSDQGPGIPEQAREAVFDRFHRLDHRDAREVYGHGLGLYLCRRLIQAMGGTITIAEGHAKGVQVEIRLPLASARSAATSEAPSGADRSTPGSAGT